jgi:hypothetical protein
MKPHLPFCSISQDVDPDVLLGFTQVCHFEGEKELGFDPLNEWKGSGSEQHIINKVKKPKRSSITLEEIKTRI